MTRADERPVYPERSLVEALHDSSLGVQPQERRIATSRQDARALVRTVRFLLAIGLCAAVFCQIRGRRHV